MHIQAVELYRMVGRFALNKKILPVSMLRQFAFHSFLEKLGLNRQLSVGDIVARKPLPREIENRSGYQRLNLGTLRCFELIDLRKKEKYLHTLVCDSLVDHKCSAPTGLC